MLIHNKKKFSTLKRHKKWKQINQSISVPTLILLFIVGIVLTAYISHEYLNYKIFILDRCLTEFLCYSVWCVLSLYISCAFIRKRADSVIAKVFALLCGAFLSTLIVFLLNSFWHYLDINSTFDWKDPLAYGIFIKNDFLYAYNFGWIRYPSVLLCVFLTGIFFNSKFVFKLEQTIKSKVQKHKYRYVEMQLTKSKNETHSAKIIPFRLPDDSKGD